MLKSGEEWVRDGNKFMVRVPKVTLLGADAPKGSDNRNPTEAELDSALMYLNEQTSYAITLHCRNDRCAAKGSWIQRSKTDAVKMVYVCETCNRPMER